MDTQCAIEGCTQERIARGWCSRHYWRWHRTGDPLKARAKLPKDAHTVCTVDGCERAHFTRGMCEMHYRRLRTNGEVGQPEPIKRRATKAKGPCEVEGCERVRKGARHCHLHTERLRRTGEVGPVEPLRVKGSGSVMVGGYRRMWGANGRRVMEHVMVMEDRLGRRLADGENVHHRNGLTGDNRIENLELWVTSQPAGQRVADLVQFVVERYRDDVLTALFDREDAADG